MSDLNTFNKEICTYLGIDRHLLNECLLNELITDKTNLYISNQ